MIEYILNNQIKIQSQQLKSKIKLYIKHKAILKIRNFQLLSLTPNLQMDSFQALCSYCRTYSYVYRVCCAKICLCFDCINDPEIVDQTYFCEMCGRQLGGAYRQLIMNVMQANESHNLSYQQHANDLYQLSAKKKRRMIPIDEFPNPYQNPYGYNQTFTNPSNQRNGPIQNNSFMPQPNCFNPLLPQTPNNCISYKNLPQKANQFQPTNGFQNLPQTSQRNSFGNGMFLNSQNQEFKGQKVDSRKQNFQQNLGYRQNQQRQFLKQETTEQQEQTIFQKNIRQKKTQVYNEQDFHQYQDRYQNMSNENVGYQTNGFVGQNHFNNFIPQNPGPYIQPRNSQFNRNLTQPINSFNVPQNKSSNLANCSYQSCYNQQQVNQNQAYIHESKQRQSKSVSKITKSCFLPFKEPVRQLNNSGNGSSQEKDLSPTFGFENNDLTLNGEIEIFGERRDRGMEIEQSEQPQLRRSNSEYTLGSR